MSDDRERKIPADEDTDDAIGVPEKLRFKRRRAYTMSPEALEQRRRAANSTNLPGAMMGNRNAWKHGQYAQGFIRTFMRPCKSTCPHYPCELVEDGRAEPGGECLDKTQIIETFGAIMRAMSDEDKKTRFKDLQEVMALQVGSSMQVVQTLLEDILRDGTILKREKWDKEGTMIGYEVVPHPSLLTLPKLLDAMGLSLKELNVTPRAIAKADDEEKDVETLAKVLSRVTRNSQQAEGVE